MSKIHIDVDASYTEDEMFIIFSTQLLECLALKIRLIRVKMTYVKDIAS